MISILEGILPIVSPSLREDAMIEKVISIVGAPTIVSNGWILYRKKENVQSKVLFVAHLDQVTGYANGVIFPVIFNGMITQFSHIADHPLGLDDKVGIAIGMKLLLEKVDCDVLFTRAEECGAIGASEYTSWHILSNLPNYKFVISADRRGYGCFTNSVMSRMCLSDEAAECISKVTGLRKTNGMMCDILELLPIAHNATNLECGYYNPHSVKEYGKISEIVATYKNVVAIIKLAKTKKWRKKKEDVYDHVYLQRWDNI